MKTAIVFCCCLLIAVAFAQDDRDHRDHHDRDHEHHERHSKIVQDLLERGQQLLEMSRAVLQKHRSHEQQHLVFAIEHEVILVEALMKDLATYHVQPDNVMSEHHLHMIEEELMFHEHRISEEIHVLEMMDRDHRHEGHSVEELIRRGEQLVQHARDILEQHRSHNHREEEALRYEMEQVEHLIQALRRHKHGESTEREEEQLARHEKSMMQLIERIEHYHRHDDDEDRHHHDRDHPHFEIMADADHYEF